MTEQERQRCWYHLTPARFFAGLLAVQVFLFLSERFRWFPFNEKKGWAVLIAVCVVGVATLAVVIWGLACLLLRRRFQFSFRSLLVFVVALSVPLGWFAWEMEQARRQRVAVERIVELGGSVSYDYVWDNPFMKPEEPAPVWLRSMLGYDFFCEVVEVDCTDTEFADDDTVRLQGLTNVEWLVLSNTQITDRGLARLSPLTKLKRLGISGTLITDAGLDHLTGLTNLRELWLKDTQITNDGLVRLERLATLEVLNLGGTQITDDGLVHLKVMTNLWRLSLIGTQITDEGLAQLENMTRLGTLALSHTDVGNAGLEHLERLPNLKWLVLYGTNVTGEGVKKLQQALPNCEIIR